MLRLAAILLTLSATEPSAIEHQSDVAWTMIADDKERFWVMSSDIKRDGKYVYVWLHSDATLNPSVKYRTGIWRIAFGCSGFMNFTAVTTRGADGRQMQTWDGYGPSTAIRPDTIYSDLEKKLCQP